MDLDINALRTAVTLLSFGIFGVIATWAWWPRNRARFEQDALLPFSDEPASQERTPHE